MVHCSCIIYFLINLMSIELAPWLQKKYRKVALAREIVQTSPVHIMQLSPEELEKRILLNPPKKKIKKRSYSKDKVLEFKYF